MAHLVYEFCPEFSHGFSHGNLTIGDLTVFAHWRGFGFGETCPKWSYFRLVMIIYPCGDYYRKPIENQ
jgi:hypothetical protein